MSDTEVRRKVFEEWAQREDLVGKLVGLERAGDGYRAEAVQRAWSYWEPGYAAGFGSRQWISVENGLPEIGKEVLAGAFIEAAFTDGRKTSSWQCCLQRWLGDKWVDADTGEEDGATHWMPLPDPPEKNL